METNSLKLALVDDQELFLDSIPALFQHLNEDIQMVWTARSGEEAIQKVKESGCPDIILMDYFFRDQTLDGGATTAQILQLFPQAKILMLSVSAELSVIKDALQKGALGYATKDCGKVELLQAIRAVAAGQVFLDQTALKEVVAILTRKNQNSIFTKRETEVALLYAKGKQIREIARDLFISEDTVESHIKNIRAKTNAGSRYEVAEYLKKIGEL